SWQLVAQGVSPAAHKGMVHAAKVMAATAFDLIRDPSLLQRAKAELKERVGDGGYRCPIADDVVARPLGGKRRQEEWMSTRPDSRARRATRSTALSRGASSPP